MKVVNENRPERDNHTWQPDEDTLLGILVEKGVRVRDMEPVFSRTEKAIAQHARTTRELVVRNGYLVEPPEPEPPKPAVQEIPVPNGKGGSKDVETLLAELINEVRMTNELLKENGGYFRAMVGHIETLATNVRTVGRTSDYKTDTIPEHFLQYKTGQTVSDYGGSP